MIVHAYYPVGETRVEREAKALLRHGFEVDVIALRLPDTPAKEVMDGVTIHRLPVRRHKGRGVAIQLLEYIVFFLLAAARVSVLHLRRRYDVVQVHNLPDFLVFAALVPKLLGARVVLDLHDLMPEFYEARFAGSPRLAGRLVLAQERLACAFADHVITVTERWRQVLIERGIPAAKVSVVMNVPDDTIFFPAAEGPVVRRANGPFRIIYHGSVTKRSGIDLVVEALYILGDEVPAELIIQGGGEFWDELVGLIQGRRLEGRVTANRGFIPTASLPDLIRGADVGVVPYRRDIFTDGLLPTKLLEYAALGVPAIASRTSGIRAYFDEDMVQYFEPEDVGDLAAVIRLLHRDADRRLRLAQNALRFTRANQWVELGDRYVQTIEDLAPVVGRAQRP